MASLSSAGTSLGETGHGAASWLLSSVLDDCLSCVEWYVVICLGGLEKKKGGEDDVDL